MKWIGRRGSSNVEDRRGMGGGRMALGGGLVTIVVIAIVWLLGGDPSQLLNGVVNQSPQSAAVSTPAEDSLAQFVSVVLADTEEIWDNIFAEYGQTYRRPKLVLFSQAVQSACGNASASSGPFYCSADERIYIDLSFCQELRDRFGAPGDFAIAYVLAHEVGHHVQNLLGTLGKVQELRGRVGEEEGNRYTVMLELQADYYAGVWAHHAQHELNIVERGDVAEAIGAAAAVGDDRLQMQSQGYIVPDAFTHGTSDQRAEWFKKGYESGRLEEGDTFKRDAI